MTETNCKEAVLAALGRYPLTIAELVHETGFAKRTINGVIKALHEAERIHIDHFENSMTSTISNSVPAYILGNGVDAKRRRASNKVLCARYREKLRQQPRGSFPLGDVWHNVASA
ncbi:hypothetical protein [Paraburkholderia kururiensis]|uniref:hypothetical protein n=1 Tax=Paraburkholderia kururiensis TaxID=984307 RepID=UPI0005A77F70|nr:hypothetical protein [Paraburkholderia kururiensis]